MHVRRDGAAFQVLCRVHQQSQSKEGATRHANHFWSAAVSQTSRSNAFATVGFEFQALFSFKLLRPAFSTVALLCGCQVTS